MGKFTPSPQPGGKRFLNILIIILIGVFLYWFFYINEKLDKKIEDTYLQKTLHEINSTLALSLYEFAVKNELEHIQKFHRGNPFVFLAAHHQLLANYEGSVGSIESISKVGVWVYEMGTNEVVYIRKTGPSMKRYQLKFEYEDLNNSGKFEKDSDRVKSFSLKEQ